MLCFIVNNGWKYSYSFEINNLVFKIRPQRPVFNTDKNKYCTSVYARAIFISISTEKYIFNIFEKQDHLLLNIQHQVDRWDVALP